MSADGGRGEAMKNEVVYVEYVVRADRVDPPVDPPATPTPPPQPPPVDDATAQARYMADQAKAEAERLKRELAEIKALVPSEDERAEIAALRSKAKADEEARMKKEGEFDLWRAQINEKHEKDLAEQREREAREKARAEAIEKELNDKLIGLEFANATEWFGPNGKTVYIPEVAQSYFARNVSVEVQRDTTGNVTGRAVVVKDNRGTVIVDAKTGKAASFANAIGELIESHPQKAYMLKGSGKVGSGSAGGGNGTDTIDLSRLRPADFNDPAIREKVKQQQNVAGGLQIGPGFDRLNSQRRKS
jgi:hypothetical protein